jgi:hypothetical protein
VAIISPAGFGCANENDYRRDKVDAAFLPKAQKGHDK